MAGFARLSAYAAEHLITPRSGPDVCLECGNLTQGFDRCYACDHGGHCLSAFLPVSYSVGGEPWHGALAAYKREADPFVGDAVALLAAVLERFLVGHEACAAAEAGVPSFDLVTTVPSARPDRDAPHPLRQIVAEFVGPTRDRHESLLRRASAAAEPHRFDSRRFEVVRPLHGGERILLIDDTWTTGANAHSAAAALLLAGAGRVACVALGRYLNPGWHENLRRLGPLRGQFDFARCTLCAGAEPTAAASPNPPDAATELRPAA
jgi:hypothetical protein